MARGTVLIVGLAIATSALPARAQGPEQLFEQRSRSVAAKIAKRTLDRARRSLVLGPHAGAAPAFDIDGGDFAMRYEFGLALLRFDIPVVPDANSIAGILQSRATERFVQLLAGRTLSDAEQTRLAEQVWQDIVDELTLQHGPRRFERPGFALRAGARYLSVDGGGAWEIGFSAGIGVSRLMLSAGESVQVNNGAGLNTDLELALPVVLGKGLRSPTAEILARASIANTDRETRADRLIFGVRAILDIL